MEKTALVCLAHGAEDMEFITPVDVLRRAGVKVTVASVGKDKVVVTAHGVRIEADALLEDIGEGVKFDVIVIPGGLKGAENCRDSAKLQSMLKAQKEAGRWIAAICASPALVLEHHGLLKGVKSCCYPCFTEKLSCPGPVGCRVCVDQNIITSIGPGSAFEFALEIVGCLVGEGRKEELKKQMCMA